MRLKCYKSEKYFETGAGTISKEEIKGFRVNMLQLRYKEITV